MTFMQPVRTGALLPQPISSRLSVPLARSGLVRNPIHFPSLPAVVRKRLLKMRHLRVRLRPDKSNDNHPAVQCVLRVELPSSILEPPDLWRNKQAVLAIRPCEVPLVRFGIVGAQREPLDVPGSGAVGLEFLDLRASIPNLPRHGSAIELHPLIRTGQRIQAALQMDFPAAKFEIEIVLPVRERRRLLRIGLRGVRARLREHGNRLRYEKHAAAQQEESPKGSRCIHCFCPRSSLLTQEFETRLHSRTNCATAANDGSWSGRQQ